MDSSNRVAVLQLSHRTDLLLQTSTTSFLLVRQTFPQDLLELVNRTLSRIINMHFSLQYKVYAVPAEDFSMEYVDPKVLCVSTHGRFTEDRSVTVTYTGSH